MEKKVKQEVSAKTGERKLEVIIDKKKNYVKIGLVGDITVRTVNGLKKKAKELIDEKNVNFVFDLSETNYMDSSGLGFFIGTLKKLKEAGGAMHLTGLKGYISGIFHLINLSTIIPIYEDAKEACKF